MLSPEVKQYQALLEKMLRQVYPETPVRTEWATMVDEENMYSPRLDIAVGPFATDQRFIGKYNSLMDSSRHFINEILAIHLQNIRVLDNSAEAPSFDGLKWKNQNARCFLTIEIENKVSRKHLMGGAINAAALGRIGIVVAWIPEKLRAFVKLRRYFRFLGSVGKNTFDTTNLLILDRNQLLQAVQNACKTKSLEHGS